ncbi:hypothetical protein BOW37_12820, partial [Solemya velum gill symbiont]
MILMASVLIIHSEYHQDLGQNCGILIEISEVHENCSFVIIFKIEKLDVIRQKARIETASSTRTYVMSSDPIKACICFLHKSQFLYFERSQIT